MTYSLILHFQDGFSHELSVKYDKSELDSAIKTIMAINPGVNLIETHKLVDEMELGTNMKQSWYTLNYTYDNGVIFKTSEKYLYDELSNAVKESFEDDSDILKITIIHHTISQCETYTR